MSDATKLAECRDLIKQAADGLTLCLSQQNVMAKIPSTYRDTIAGIRDDCRDAVIGSMDDVRALLAKQRFNRKLIDRVQTVLNAAAEGKGGADFPGPPIPSSSEASRVVTHVNTVARVAKLAGVV